MTEKVLFKVKIHGRQKEIEIDPNDSDIDLSDRKIEELDLGPSRSCTGLKSIMLTNNRLKNIDLRPLSSCSSLISLLLTYNQLQSVSLSPLSSCSGLEYLSLANNQLKNVDLVPLSSCLRLEHLDLAYNQLQNIDLVPLQSCARLNAVCLYNNQLQSLDLSPLGSCSELHSLLISNNKLQSLDLLPLASASALTYLDLSFNQLQGLDLSPLASCLSLQKLDLSSNRLQEIDVTPLFNLSKMEKFHETDEIVTLGDYGLKLDASVRVVADISLKYKPRNTVPEPIRTLIEEGRVEFLEGHAAEGIQSLRTPKQRIATQPTTPHASRSSENRQQRGRRAKQPPVGKRSGTTTRGAGIQGHVHAVRGHEIVGGSLHYKVKVTNDSDYVVTDVTVTIVAFPSDCLQMQGNVTAHVSKIEPHGSFRAPLFVLTPTLNCVEGVVHASVSYVDHLGESHVFSVEPDHIRSVCDLLTPISATLEEFLRLFETMSNTTEERTVSWNAQALFCVLERMLPVLNLQVINTHSTIKDEQFYGAAKALARGKYGGKRVALDMKVVGTVTGKECKVTLHAGADDEAMLPSLLADIVSRLEKLQSSVNEITGGVQKLMTAADEMSSTQEVVLEVLKKLQDATDENAMLTRQIMDSVASKLDSVEESQERVEQTVQELVDRVEQLADAMLPKNKTLRDRLVLGVKEKAKDVTKRKAEQVLWEMAKVALRVLTGLPIP